MKETSAPQAGKGQKNKNPNLLLLISGQRQRFKEHNKVQGIKRVTQCREPAAVVPPKTGQASESEAKKKLKKDGHDKVARKKTFSPHSHFLNVIVL